MNRFKRTPEKKVMDRSDALLLVTERHRGAKLIEKLTAEEREELIQFVTDNDHLPYLEFEYKVNRWHLDDPAKPKNLFVMHELALAANTRAHG